MTTADLISGILEREKGYSDRAADRGGPTNFGITALTLGLSRGLGKAASVIAVQNLTVEEARGIYLAEYLPPFRAVLFPELQAQCIDIGVTSGVETAIGMLQAVLGVPVDHVLGPQTIGKLSVTDWTLVNNALVGYRCHFFSAIADHDAKELDNLHGWIRRAVSFVVQVGREGPR